MIGALGLIHSAKGGRFAHQTRQRNGKAGGGQGEQDIIKIVRHIEMGKTLISEDVAQRNFINKTEDLDNYHGDGQNNRAMQEILALVFSQNGTSEYFIRKKYSTFFKNS